MKIEHLVPVLFLLATGTSSAHAGAASYGDVQLCDGVNLADDNIAGWGCWNNLDPTAAGPGAGGGAFMALPSGDGYRQNPAFSQQSGFECPAGAVCGHAVYWNAGNSEGPNSTFYPAHIVAYASATGPADAMGNTPFQVSYQLVPINSDDPIPSFAESGQLTGRYQTFGGSAASILPQAYSVIYGSRPGGSKESPSPLVVGPFWISNYVSGTMGAYVTGTATPSTALLSSLAVNNVSATYTGSELFSGNAVSINVNFGQAAWSGTWGSGGPTAWNAAGTVTGGNIQSTGIGGYYNSGQVQGSFYGGNAEALAGVADVRKLVSNTVTERHVDLFITDRTGLLGYPTPR